MTNTDILFLIEKLQDSISEAIAEAHAEGREEQMEKDADIVREMLGEFSDGAEMAARIEKAIREQENK